MASSNKRARDPVETSEIPAAIAADIDKLRRYHAELGELIGRLEVDRSPADKVSRHFRRHLPLYALGTVWALMIILIPTVNERGTTTSAGTLTQGGGGELIDGTETAGPGDVKGSAVGGGSTRGVSAGPADVTGESNVPAAQVTTGSGITRGGFECEPGVRQLPFSAYANACVAKFSGSNGGETYRGVSDKKIRIAIRAPAVDAGDITDAQNDAQGRATRAEGIALLKKYAGWFGKVFELYGRELEFVDFNSTVSNGVDEAQSKGKEGACADATEIAESIKAFAVVGYNPSLIESQPFADCATERGLFVPYGGSYFPEQYYARWHPYVWHIYTQCEQIGHDVAEYAGKRLLNRNAKWAKDPVYQKQKRVFGTYVPDNDGYQRCVNITETDFKEKYNGTVKHRFDYELDVSKFPQQAEQAVVQFKAEGVTTLLNACDTLSTRFMTDAANRQQWGPEWFIIGVALQDTDGAARTFNQSVVNGHLFGMSQLGQIRLIEGKDGEAYKAWKLAFPNEDLPDGFGDAYFRVLGLYMMLQAAGPVLTPQNIARGLQSMPDGGGANGAFGTWSFKGDHTAIDDSREIYWAGNAKGYDGNAGAYLESYGGKRFRSGQWPAEEPPVYPAK